MLQRLSATLLVFLAAGCAAPAGHAPAPEEVRALLRDDVFAAEPAEVDEVALFRLPAGLRAELDRDIAVVSSEELRYRALRRWIFDQARRYEYDPGTTVGLAELEAVRRINCFSFSVLYVAAARHLGLDADIQLVYSPPDWSIDQSNWVLNQHINVAGRVHSTVDNRQLRQQANLPLETGTHIRSAGQSVRTVKYVVDLNPKIVVNVHRTEILDDAQVLARFYSNKAAEALVAEDHGRAYAYSRRAIEADGASSAAWTNLGVLYARSQRPALARDAYRTAILVDDDADSARNNLAVLYRQIGEVESAAEMERTIRNRRRRNPYYHHRLGRSEHEAGAYEQAIVHFRDAIRRKSNEQLFYLSLAESQLALQRNAEARTSLDRARRHAAGEHAEVLVMLEQELLERTHPPDSR